MPDRLTLAAGAITVLAGVTVLIGWSLGLTTATSLVAGWRVMVPSTAFGFVSIGLGLTAAARLRADDRMGMWTVRLFAMMAAVVPLFTVAEYLLHVRFGV